MYIYKAKLSYNITGSQVMTLLFINNTLLILGYCKKKY